MTLKSGKLMSFSSFECDMNFSRFSFHFVTNIVVVIVAIAVSLSTFLGDEDSNSDRFSSDM